MKKILISLLVLASCLSLLVLTGCGGNNGGGEQATGKLTLIDKDNTKYEYDLKFTDGTTLREALFESGLISEEEHGAMFIQNIDGHIADVLNDGCTWLPVDENGEQIMGSFDEITLHSGDHMILQYYVVPDMD